MSDKFHFWWCFGGFLLLSADFVYSGSCASLAMAFIFGTGIVEHAEGAYGRS